jgi:hypothetical protein
LIDVSNGAREEDAEMAVRYPSIPKEIAERRAPHALNGRMVSLRAGCQAQGQGGKCLGGDLVAQVWAVDGDRAVLHFGESMRVGRGGREECISTYGRAIASVSDLVEVRS